MPLDGTAPARPPTAEMLLLDKAIDLLHDPNRWCRGVMTDQEGRHCVFGALEAAAFALPMAAFEGAKAPCFARGGAVMEAAEALAREVVRLPRWRSMAHAAEGGIDRMNAITTFNDSSHTTHAQVMHVLICARHQLSVEQRLHEMVAAE